MEITLQTFAYTAAAIILSLSYAAVV